MTGTSPFWSFSWRQANPHLFRPLKFNGGFPNCCTNSWWSTWSEASWGFTLCFSIVSISQHGNAHMKLPPWHLTLQIAEWKNKAFSLEANNVIIISTILWINQRADLSNEHYPARRLLDGCGICFVRREIGTQLRKFWRFGSHVCSVGWAFWHRLVYQLSRSCPWWTNCSAIDDSWQQIGDLPINALCMW